MVPRAVLAPRLGVADEKEHLAVVPAAVRLGHVRDVERGQAVVGVGAAGVLGGLDLGDAAGVGLVGVGWVVVVPDVDWIVRTLQELICRFASVMSRAKCFHFL